ITPPFQVPDEPSHFAYVKQLAESHALPSSSRREFSEEENVVLLDLRQTPYMPATGTISSLAQQRRFERELDAAAEEPREGSPAAGVATSQPPLYYAYEAIPYTLAYGANLLGRLALMRLFSALLGGLTALFVYLFLREALPASRFGALAGGLAVAFAPLLGFMSGAVNPDALLFAVSAALFWSLARSFRRGLTYRRTVSIGMIVAVGLLSKVNFLGLLPGAIAGLAVLSWRARSGGRISPRHAFALGTAIGLFPAVAYALANLAAGQAAFGFASSAATLVHGSWLRALEYTWKLFLPRLPFLHPYVPGLFTTKAIWLNGFVGQYGWLETSFPGWVYDLAMVVAALLQAATALALVSLRATVRERLAELCVYALMALGLLILIGGASFYSVGGGESYTQARYLLPLLCLFAAGLALAARALGRRLEPVLGTLIVLALFADDIFSQLLVIARYYG
ncbi:MAG: DUF2142 domain-containing protein, partial [Acidobacteriota bacterium]|nr:DUF2142 domain-containing protein [Acidobacteriota bacterium]